jgi:hypothetical protein
MPTLLENERHPICLIINFAAGEVEEAKLGDDTILWKDMLAEGVVARTPNMKEKVPFKVVPTGRSSARKDNIVVSMSDLMEAFEARAFQDVTIPDGHPKPDRVLKDGRVIKGDSALNNTGYVRGLRVVKKRIKQADGSTGPEVHVLQAGMGFTEPDAAGKVKRGTVPNVSAGIFFDHVRQADQRYFRAALNHCALTKYPWMQNLEPFERAYFTDEEAGDTEFEFNELVLADETGNSGGGAKVIWNDFAGSAHVRDAISQSLNPIVDSDSGPLGVPERPRAYYYVQDVTHNSPNLAQVEESYKGKTSRWVVPYDQDDDGNVTVSPQTHWQEGTMAMIAASDTPATVASFEENSYEALTSRLNVALADMFGDKHKLVIDKVSTDERAEIRNSDTGAVHHARFYRVGPHTFFSDTAEWTTVKLASPKAPTPKVYQGNVVKLDTTTPEGRVGAARQRRALLLSTSK